MTAAERIVARQAVRRLPQRLAQWWAAHREAVYVAILMIVAAALYVLESWLDDRERRAAVDQVILRQTGELTRLRAQQQYWRDTPCIPQAPSWSGTSGRHPGGRGVRT